MRNKGLLIAAASLALCLSMGAPNVWAQAGTKTENALQLADSESLLSMRVDGELVITPDGQVGEYKITTKDMPGEITSLIAKSIAGWRFEPIKDEQGSLIAAKTHMRVTLVAREKEKGSYAVEMENVRFHNGVRINEARAVRQEAKEAGVEVSIRPRPNYPDVMLSNGISGAALVNILFSEDGKVVDAVVVQSAMFNVRGQSGLIEKAFKEMEREALRSVKRMRVKFGRGVDPKDPEVSSGMIAIRFSVIGSADQSDSMRKAGVWRLEQRGPLRTPSWEIEKAGVRVGISDLDGSEGLISNQASKIKPRTGVPVL